MDLKKATEVLDVIIRSFEFQLGLTEHKEEGNEAIDALKYIRELITPSNEE